MTVQRWVEELNNEDVRVAKRSDFKSKPKAEYSTERVNKSARLKKGDDNLYFMYAIKNWLTKEEYEAAIEIRWLMIRRDAIEGRRDTLTRLGHVTCDFKGHVDGLEAKLQRQEEVFKCFEGWSLRLIHAREILAMRILRNAIAEQIIEEGKMPSDVRVDGKPPYTDYRDTKRVFKKEIQDYIKIAKM